MDGFILPDTIKYIPTQTLPLIPMNLELALEDAINIDTTAHEKSMTYSTVSQAGD